jgi:hypothetical protein
LNGTMNDKRSPIHVVYGGADRFSADTPSKLGRIALETLEEYVHDFVVFARVFELKGADRLPQWAGTVPELVSNAKEDPEKLRRDHFPVWFAWNVHRKTIEKLRSEPVEDFRIDFEDGYGFRSDEEEDRHAIATANELASAFANDAITAFSGFRVKSFGQETYARATRTIELFLGNLLERSSGRLPENFVVTLPKVTDAAQVRDLCDRLDAIEKERGLSPDSIGVELMIETPESIVDRDGRFAVRRLVDAAEGRCTSVHFGAYDYTAALGISASHQDIRHPACNFARQAMQAALAGTGVRLVDSVTTLMPVPVHKGETLSEDQRAKNKAAVHAGWLRHFRNVSASMADGFYQSWDLHPNQLVARYAAVYAFFLEEFDPQAARLRAYIEKATKATLTGNTFDDAASVAGLVNFFERGIACGAFSEAEVTSATGATIDDLFRQFRMA